MTDRPIDPGLGSPNNSDDQAQQAAQLTEPAFDHHLPAEAEMLTAEFGPPDADGVWGRNADRSGAPGTSGATDGARA